MMLALLFALSPQSQSGANEMQSVLGFASDAQLHVSRLVLAPGICATRAESAIGLKTGWLDSSTLALIADFELPTRLKSALALLLEALRVSSKGSK